MKRSIFLTLVATLLVAGPAYSQEEQEDTSGEGQTATERREGERQAGEGLIDRIRRAARLPEAADEAREAGVPEEEVQEVLSTGKRRRVPAGDVDTVLRDETRVVREEGRTGESDGLIKRKMEEGLRGRELIEAVRQERTARREGRAEAGDRTGARRDTQRTGRERRRPDSDHVGHDHAQGDDHAHDLAADEHVDDASVDSRRDDMKRRGKKLEKGTKERKNGRKEDR